MMDTASYKNPKSYPSGKNMKPWGSKARNKAVKPLQQMPSNLTRKWNKASNK